MATRGELETAYAEWWTPSQVLKKLSHWGFETTAPWVSTRLSANMIEAAAGAFQKANAREAAKQVVMLPPEVWNGWACLVDHNFWDTGDVTLYTRGSGYGGHLIGTWFDVRFNPKGFEGVVTLPAISPLPVALPPAPVQQNAGGRPAKGWWEDLWIEIGRQLYEGDLKPDKQADIEKAMHDWLATIGETASEETIRSRARKLYRALSKEG